MTLHSMTQVSHNILPGLELIERSPMADPPSGLQVDNMRGRGFDRCTIMIEDAQTAGGRRNWLHLLLRSRSSQIRQINITSDTIGFGPAPKGSRQAPETLIALSDFKAITIRPAARMNPAVVSIQYSTTGSPRIDRIIELGRGLSEDALTWLRDRLLLEIAGLVAKPMFNLGRRTTRYTTNPDDDPYQLWVGKRFRLTELLLDETLQRLDEIQAALDKQDWDTAIRLADRMKSSSAAGGAMLLCDLFQRLEVSCTTNEPAEAAAMLVHIRAEYEKVKRRVSKDASARPVATIDGSTDSEEADHRFADKHVLLIEDSLVNQELVLDCLKSAGCRATTAKTGEAGIELWLKTHFDLILMDCQMPGMGGLEATRAIRRAEFSRGRTRVPIVALTANALDGDREQCFTAGMNGYLSKPYHTEDLLAVMHQLLIEQRVEQQTPSSAPGNEPLEMAMS